MGNIWLVPTPSLERNHTIKIIMWHPILDIGCTFYSLSPKLWWKSFSLHHASCHLLEWSILSLSNTILLWCVRNRMLHLDTSIFTILDEIRLDILTAIVRSEDLEFPPRLVLPDWFSTKGRKTLKRSKTSDLCFRKTQQYLEKSSMKVSAYLAWLMDI